MTATAEVIQLHDDADTVFLHPWTPLVTEAREHHGLVRPQDIAEWMCDLIEWSELSRQSRITLLVRIIETNERGPKGDRRRTFHTEGEGTRESPMRMSVAPSVWDVPWIEVGGKTTRDLTIADVEALIEAYRLRAVGSIIRMRWLQACKDLAEKKKVKTLGELEARGIALPSESKVEAGE